MSTRSSKSVSDASKALVVFGKLIVSGSEQCIRTDYVKPLRNLARSRDHLFELGVAIGAR